MFLRMVKPLKEGDCIGVAAPSSPFDKNLFKHGVALLKKLGFDVWHREDIFSQERYLAGSDERRALELTELFKKKDVKAILFARGGYGSQRIIPHLKKDILKKYKKPVVGFSDVTALLTFLRQEVGTPTFYGPVVTQLGAHASERTLQILKSNLTQTTPLNPFDLKECTILKEGSCQGPLVGGCLSLLTSSMGTSYELNTKGSILFFEDTGEKVYALDRMLTQLKNAGKLNGVQGIIAGHLKLKEGEVYSTEAMLKDILQDFEGPVVADFPAGHLNDFFTLPLGIPIKLQTTSKKIFFLESLFQ